MWVCPAVGRLACAVAAVLIAGLAAGCGAYISGVQCAMVLA
jgi:hypothetical protein